VNKFLKLLAVSLFSISSSVFAQSAFQGFYGQIATGYENNSASNLDGVYKEAARIYPDTYNASTQNFGGAPLIVGLGYNFSVAPKFILGVGVDYSFTSQTSSAYNSNYSFIDSTFSGQSLKVSNRLNIFVTPGYEIDKDKLIYLKAGYSSVKATYNPPTTNDGEPTTQTWSTPSSTVGGYILGLGYKQIITGGFYGFAEGNYMSYNKPSLISNVSDSGASTWTMTTNPSISTYQLLVGVGYKF
jgi:hypothetical protein